MNLQNHEVYPRPDFERKALKWVSLNGPWDFLFDDEDIGLMNKWQRRGLPDSSVAMEPDQGGHGNSESDSVTQKIAAGTQELIKNNIFTRGREDAINKKRTIQVPFVFQCPASGINDRGLHEVLWYQRDVNDPRSAEDRAHGKRVLLRFGAVDYEARVWVNGQSVGGHRGGHVPFELDISDELDSALPEGSTSRITVRAYDSAYDLTQPRGKQYWGPQPESIFYTPSGGIWQNVWLEVVPQARLGDSSHGTLIRATDLKDGKIDATVHVLGRCGRDPLSVEIEASFSGQQVSKSERKQLPNHTNKVSLSLDTKVSEAALKKLPDEVLAKSPLSNDNCWRNGIALWSPEHPLLYDLTIRLYDKSGNVLDEVQTSTGVRSIDWSKGDGIWRLNDKPYFQALCLDQGYWPETFLTPPIADSVRQDISLAKKMGFNGCRKHQKVEDPAFYYWADKLGYLVWGEMASAYSYSDEYVDRYNQEWSEAIKLVINHPSVVTWTLVNESWGYTSLKDNVEQRNHIRSLYHFTKALDPTRPINDNCGWEHVCTDLTTFHDYGDAEKMTKICNSVEGILDKKAGRDMFVAEIPGKDRGAKHIAGTPIMCTEFGGVNISHGGERDWGYTTASNPDDLLGRVKSVTDAVIDGGYCCAFVYTQLSDIEQEANGLYSFDRKEKLDATKVKEVFGTAMSRFYNRIGAKNPEV